MNELAKPRTTAIPTYGIHYEYDESMVGNPFPEIESFIVMDTVTGKRLGRFDQEEMALWMAGLHGFKV